VHSLDAVSSSSSSNGGSSSSSIGGGSSSSRKTAAAGVTIPRLEGDFSLNAANVLSADLLLRSGLSRLCPTHDLNVSASCCLQAVCKLEAASSQCSAGKSARMCCESAGGNIPCVSIGLVSDTTSRCEQQAEIIGMVCMQ
jgi:hypothetical protein